MPEDNEKHEPADPVGVWEQWYETAYRTWKNSTGGSEEGLPDPANLYRSWLKNIAEAQNQFNMVAPGLMNPQEAWMHWFEATTDIWKQASERGADPLGLMAQWLEMMEEARAKLSAGGALPADPFTFLKQWYDATSETWSKVVGDMIGTEKFIEMSSQLLDSYASFIRTFSQASAAYFSQLQLATRSDIARVAELVINLEEKVDQLDNEFEDFQDAYNAQMTTGEVLSVVSGRLEGVEGNIAAFLPAVAGLEKRLEGVESNIAAFPPVVTSLEKRLEGVESNVAAFPPAVAGLEKRLEGVESNVAAFPPAVASLEKRLERVESKLDTLLGTLEKAGREQTPKAASPAPATSSQAQHPRPAVTKQPAAQQAPVEAESVGDHNATTP